jgi:hypothetical protein
MSEENSRDNGRDAAFWRRIYLAVIAFTFIVVTALWAFSRYFS